jgi:uncharacterized protein YcbX
MLQITELNIYPVKSCRGISLTHVLIGPEGLVHDREWMVVHPDGRFMTQREQPRLALIVPALTREFLVLRAPESGELRLPLQHQGAIVTTEVWGKACQGFDAGDVAAEWLSQHLQTPARLIRFDQSRPRLSDHKWTGGVDARNRFSDGYPLLLISQASLDDLNARLETPVPMNRFRPNLVVSGLEPYGEDRLDELAAGDIRLRIVKPCTRCVITTTDQETGKVTGPEPLQTLRSYRFGREPQGIWFGQNVIVATGVGRELRLGMSLQPRFKSENRANAVD